MSLGILFCEVAEVPWADLPVARGTWHSSNGAGMAAGAKQRRKFDVEFWGVRRSGRGREPQGTLALVPDKSDIGKDRGMS